MNLDCFREMPYGQTLVTYQWLRANELDQWWQWILVDEVRRTMTGGLGCGGGRPSLLVVRVIFPIWSTGSAHFLTHTSRRLH